MIVLELAPSELASDMEGERPREGQGGPGGPRAADEVPHAPDSAQSTPEAGDALEPPRGAIPKSRSLGRLDAIRTSLREVGRNGSFKLGRKKDKQQEGEGQEEKKRKPSKKAKKKVPAGDLLEEPPLGADVVEPKVSRATSLVRKLSMGRYRGKGRSKGVSPSSTSPELTPAVSPAASRTDASEEEGAGESSASEGPVGGAAAGPSTSASQPPPRAQPAQSRLIGRATNKGASAAGAGGAAAAGLAPLPEGAPSPDSLEYHSASASLDESPTPTAALDAPFMSAPAPAPVTKSRILSITAPAVRKQQQAQQQAQQAQQPQQTQQAQQAPPLAEPPRAPGSAALAQPLHPPRPATPPTPIPASSDEPEADQFGDDVDDMATTSSTSPSAPSPPPSAAQAMAEARARLSHSLSGSVEAPAAPPVSEKREHLYKILVIGELGTGKTSIIKRYVHQFFSQHYRATIGVDFALKVLNWDANTVIRLQLWDIAGQERFGNMTRVYYKEAVGAFVVFDVTRAATFDAVVKWKQDLDAKVQLPDGSPIPCVLLANKCDQLKEGIVNNSTKMDEYCKEKGFSAWFETSAKENINIEDAARCLVTKILQNDKLIHNDNDKDNDKFALDGKLQKDQKSGKSCSC